MPIRKVGRETPISETDTLQYNSPNQNHVTPSPTRVFPDLEQILANNTNAETGTCPPGPVAPPVPIPVKECYSEFLPTTDYVGFAGVKGLGGGFGERALQPWGESIMKQLVHETVEEALKCERGQRLLGERQEAVEG